MENPLTEKKIFLLDAYALIFRAHYAFIKNPRFNSKGLNTSAILGFTNTLLEIIQKEKPSHLAVVFDPPTPTFRKKMFPAYKAQRPPAPQEIIDAVPHIKLVLEAMNISYYEIENFEADDTIGTLAKQSARHGFTCYMMTSDKDYFQLIEENIFLYRPKRSGNQAEIYGVEETRTKWKIDDPAQIIDILAIWGDTADNIPGIPGIGEKTAIKLISKYKSTDGLYAHLHELKGKQKENVEQSRELVKKSKELVTIVTDVPVIFEPEKLRLKDFNTQKLEDVLSELEFNTLAKRILSKQNATTPQPAIIPRQGTLFGTSAENEPFEPALKLKNIHTTDHHYRLVETAEEAHELVSLLLSQKEFCFDTETTSLDVLTAELLGIAFSVKKTEAYYLNVHKTHSDLLEIIKPALENKEILKINQNLKYDIQVLKQHGIHVRGKLFDTMVAHYLLFPEKKHKLDSIAEQMLNYQMVAIEELIGDKKSGQKNMSQVAPEKIKEYACEDADITLQLKTLLEKLLLENQLMDLFESIEMPLIRTLMQMELWGVKINDKRLQAYSAEMAEEIVELEKQIQQMAGVEFNVGSPKQLGEVLFERLKIVENAKKTKTKQYATGEAELQKIKDKHEIVGLILEHRSLKKLHSGYLEALPKLVHKKTGRIHTSFNQTIATTGRLSSTNPNLQNIPVRTAAGRKIREAFEATSSDFKIVAADYSQVELRLMAHLSEDSAMIEAFKNNTDIHTATASKIFNVPATEVTKAMRNQAKSANFGIIYGISSFGLAQNIGISRREAKVLIDNYFESYPMVKTYMENNIKLAYSQLFVPTIKGRKRFLYDINSSNAIAKGNAERNAINAPIQGSAADIIKIAMNNVFGRLKKEQLQAKMILQVHDELVFECPNNEIDTLKTILREEMENCIELRVPLTIDIGVGNNWLEAH